ncbi:MAG TPA: NAD(P)-dependent oxidoreductase [Opitutaceae bacterium]|nr:NAD(P)-dependent oxidoreductase [Opitutaceae bacterium]
MSSSAAAKPPVAFLGLGLMGAGMAHRLAGAGFPLVVYNRNREKSAPLGAAGARIAASPREAAAGAQIIVSMVADDAASRGMWLGDSGALAGAARGTLLIESSTLTVDWVNELAKAATARGCEFIDAPVTGSRPQAAAGELNFLVGGTAASLENARVVLSVMGRSVTHLGPVGSGAMLKLINNFLCGVQAASLAEAMAMIERTGLDRARALEILTTGAPGSPLLKTFSGRMTAADFTPNFLLRLMAKDLTYARQEGNHRGIEMTTAAAALQVFQRAIDKGDGDKDVSAVVEQFRSKP